MTESPLASASTKVSSSGAAELFVFPYLIHASPGPVTPVTIAVGGGTQTIYWPFVHDGRDAPELRRPLWTVIPVPPGMPSIPAATPALDSAGALWKWRTRTIYANAMRIDFHPAMESDVVATNAARLMGLCRWYTGQWWITRDNRFHDTPMPMSLAIDDSGAPVGELVTTHRIVAKIGFEKPLTENLFAEVGRAYTLGQVIPLHMELFFDSVYAHAVADGRRAVLDGAGACDAAVWHACSTWAKAKGIPASVARRPLKPSSLTYNLESGLPRLIARSFAEERPNAFRILSDLWRLRGHVAHGKAISLSMSDTATFSKTILELINWLETASAGGGGNVS